LQQSAHVEHRDGHKDDAHKGDHDHGVTSYDDNKCRRGPAIADTYTGEHEEDRRS
jgi:hypothetical protein